MKIDPKKTTHLLFFIIFLPTLSVSFAYLLNFAIQALSAKYPSQWYFLIDTVGALGAYGLLYKLFDLYLWKYLPFKSFGTIDMPIMEGRWKGKILSSHDNRTTPIEAVLEIKQTFSDVSVCMYMRQSQSYSQVAGFVTEDNGQIALHFEYLNVPNDQASDGMNPHFGTGFLVLQPGGRKIEGEYYNSPRFSRGHAGRYEFKFDQIKLLHHI